MKNGTYRAEKQPDIVVVHGGDLPDGMHGPWVTWRFPWATETTTTIWYKFEEMVKFAGYVLAE